MSKFIIILDEYGLLILKGVGVTLLLSIMGTILGLIFALILGSIVSLEDSPFDNKWQKNIKQFLKWGINIYVTIFRGTPMIVQAIIFYYSFLKMGINWSPIIAGLFTVTINTTAYLTEVIRGGIHCVNKDQTEAGLSIGLSRVQTFIYLVLPQALKNAMASIGNELVINIKDTSVLSVIMIMDLYNACMMAAGKYYFFIESMLIAAAIYLFLTMFFTIVLRFIEKKIGAPLKQLSSSN